MQNSLAVSHFLHVFTTDPMGMYTCNIRMCSRYTIAHQCAPPIAHHRYPRDLDMKILSDPPECQAGPSMLFPPFCISVFIFWIYFIWSSYRAPMQWFSSYSLTCGAALIFSIGFFFCQVWIHVPIDRLRIMDNKQSILWIDFCHFTKFS